MLLKKPYQKNDDKFTNQSIAEEVAIGKAIGELFINTPEQLDFGKWFSSAPLMPENLLEHLTTCPSVLDSPEEMQVMYQYGITPLDVFHGIDSVSGLIDRAARYGDIDDHEPFVFEIDIEGTVCVPTAPLNGKMFVTELGMTCQIPLNHAELLFTWILNYSKFLPYLFEGFKAEHEGNKITLRRTNLTFDTFRDRLQQREPINKNNG